MNIKQPTFPENFFLSATINNQSGLIGTADQTPWGGVLSFLGVIVVLVFILFLAYWCTKFIGKKYGAQYMHGRHIEVVERVMLEQDRTLYIIRLKDKMLLLRVTAHHIEKLEELDPLLYANLPEQPIDADGFSSLLKDALSKSLGAKPKNKKDQNNE